MPPIKGMVVMDPVHGPLVLDPLQEELIQTPEVQRLNFIHQLGMSFHVYPGAHGMRFAHALGVSMIARTMGEQLVAGADDLRLSDSEVRRQVRTLAAAGLLHDVCHTPWSHTLEPLYVRKFGGSHMDVVRGVVTGSAPMDIPGAGRIPAILARHDVDPELVAALINKRCTRFPYLQQMIFGEVDADTLDYLKRDFHNTGVSFGHIDINRLVGTMIIHDRRLLFRAKGLQAVRNFLNARVEMYSSVYLHKTTRVADLMFLRAALASILELGEFPSFPTMTDDELLSLIIATSRSEYARDLAVRTKYRQGLFKRAYHIEAGADRRTARAFMAALAARGQTADEIRTGLEGQLCAVAGVRSGYIVVDLPERSTELSEERFKELGIRFLTEAGEEIGLAELDRPFAEYIRRASPSRSVFSVYCEEASVERVARETERLVRDLTEPLFRGVDSDPAADDPAGS